MKSNCYRSEPTSIVKSTSILPAVAASLGISGSTRSPIAYATPNLLELAEMYRAAHAEPLNLTLHDVWWRVIDDFAISQQFRMELERLARLNASNEDSSKGTLSFLIDDGIAQMAVNLLPFFQTLIIKCGERGLLVVMRVSGQHASTSEWAKEHSNLHERRVVAHGKSSTEMVVVQHVPGLSLPTDSILNVTGAGDTLVGSILASLLLKPNRFSNPRSLSDTLYVGQNAAILTLQSQYAVSPVLSSKNLYRL